MTEIPMGVLTVYGAVAVWGVLAIVDYKKKTYKVSLGFGLVLAIVLNVRLSDRRACGGHCVFLSAFTMFLTIWGCLPERVLPLWRRVRATSARCGGNVT